MKRGIQSIKNVYHLLRALLANIFFGFPSRKLRVIGVTGTDGKTTTTHLIYHILCSSGKKVSMISTIFAKIGEKEYDTGFHVTTPDAILIPKYLKMAADQGQAYFVLETTSHRLDQNQLAGTQFDMAVITNITHEHLDYHKTINEYARTKMKLIQMAKIGIVNVDDKVTKEFIASHEMRSVIKTYGLKRKADYSHDFRREIPDLADFNAYNYLAAYAVCRELGVSDQDIRKACATFRLPAGRIDIVYKKDFMVIVDFAHTPNAITLILETVRKQYLRSPGRLIHVFGSAGLRDQSKRFSMGKASATYANISYITEEDYRTEDPQKIADEIGAGFGKKHYFIELDREIAIQKAISSAKPNDVVIITGKGHEKSLCRGKTEHPWDDVLITKKILKL
ncbi:UDP-N-acetylmuramoyl-L-alanyl-D-glutamate--2,6-diaminopimelate ligase [Candidatus Roizmanbacteria bacterium CG_4_10_14_0_8_um_filter_39_9]|uniref:UDP-N-acetylmuramoyl-L-alanyl-D-glutamate--2, 6-diaminopimelate ligase n=1 Tax=Candidatus Roizmanbacteria bacterium CG_4_10_14_0_8_um_filter_39_9 TaxID=1974829 RepID=A0A2M7QCG8_9BACT|nr:MAG: UDP-N-acetylmuramoyl-L-alanyl-D-glutamate--2,6-diaminopimelate ligase [Candidatus Roizmanbacteria bacterium CG_4_10_14_0_8_um_filter_39_9]